MATRTTHAQPADQLDLFAELDALEREERAADAPGLFDLDRQVGYFARVERAQAWRAAYGGAVSARSAHAWVPCISEMFSDHQPTAVCRPTILTADLRCDHYRVACSCVGDLYYRGACFGCSFEGPVRGRENPAVEDAHDHAWPGWRELPIVATRPEPGPRARQKTATGWWVAAVNAAYPEGWLEADGPIRTIRGRCGTRHVPARTGFGGYDLCGQIEPEPDPKLEPGR